MLDNFALFCARVNDQEQVRLLRLSDAVPEQEAEHRQISELQDERDRRAPATRTVTLRMQASI